MNKRPQGAPLFIQPFSWSPAVQSTLSNCVLRPSQRFKIIGESLNDFDRAIRPFGFNRPFSVDAQHYAEKGLARHTKTLRQRRDQVHLERPHTLITTEGTQLRALFVGRTIRRTDLSGVRLAPIAANKPIGAIAVIAMNGRPAPTSGRVRHECSGRDHRGHDLRGR